MQARADIYKQSSKFVLTSGPEHPTFLYTDAHAMFRSYYKEEDIGLVTAES